MVDAPPAAEFNFMKTKVVKPHHATDETQLELRLNDIVYVLEQDDSGWWGGHKEGEDCTGWFPGSCVRELEEEEEAPEPVSEPLPMGYTEQLTGSFGLAAVAEEGTAQIQKACKDGLDLDQVMQDPLHHGNRLVASPNRRVSGGIATSPNRRVSATQNESTTSLSNLQAEYRNVVATNEEQTLEIKRLHTELADARAERTANAHWRTEELHRQCQSFKAEKEELQKRVQDLSMQLEAAEGRASLSERRTVGLREELTRAEEQLTKAQQESRDANNEVAQLRRRLQEKESALLKALEHSQPQQPFAATASQEPAAKPQASPSKTMSDETRRRLFPSTADSTLAGLPATEKDLAHSMLDVTADETSVILSATSTMETVPRLNAFRQPPHPPSSAGRPTPAHSAPRPGAGRSNSLTRPAFRQSPCASSSSMLLSPGGLAKCLSTGDLPPTPSRFDVEVPTAGCVKEKIGLFEQAAQRCGTPSRMEGRRPATEGDLSFHALPRPLGGSQRSPATEKCLRENPHSARNASRQPFQSSEAMSRMQLPGLDIQEAEEQVIQNFNMSPMKRHA